MTCSSQLGIEVELHMLPLTLPALAVHILVTLLKMPAPEPGIEQRARSNLA